MPEILSDQHLVADPLSDDDIEKLFSGAPQFFVRALSYFPGAPHPSVAFPFDEELEIRDLSDHVQIEAAAWSGVTSWPHLTRDTNRDAEARREVEETRRAHFHVRCRERPNMLSMQGLERGTLGFQAALELGVSDSLEEEQFGFESLGTKARAVIEARERMLSRDGWLHRIPHPELLDRLRRNGELYRNNTLRRRGSTETYNDLFHSLMRPAKIALIDKKDPHSIPNQINALLKCLGSPNVWIDLTHVEWRIRLGQILWGKRHGDELDDDTFITAAGSSTERVEEKYWLLLQILVSSELLVRLDAITEGEEYGAASFRTMDVVQFERAATPAVKWSVLLARSWMENVEILREDPPPLFLNPAALYCGGPGPAKGVSRGARAVVGKGMGPLTDSGTATGATTAIGHGWLASLASKVSLHNQHKHGNRPPSPPHFYTIRGRHGKRQVNGLMHFARKLMWPGIDEYERRIRESVKTTAGAPVTVSSQPQTPTPSPAPEASKRDSYFGAWDVTCQRGHHHERARARRRRMAAALHSSGWLSKSYVYGLMLPGDALSHFLMATLLENDSEALSRVGSFANLSSGFVYSERSFWSTSCIVGRVLAAAKGSVECMGWVSTDICPAGVGEGWINIEVHDVASDVTRIGKKARIWGKRGIERESSITGDGKEDAVLPTDFIIPHENNYSTSPPRVCIVLEGFELAKASMDLMHPTPLSEIVITTNEETCEAPDLASYPAVVSFRGSMNGEEDVRYTFALKYDVDFVTAHPCSPSRRVRVLKSPCSPTLQGIDVDGSHELDGSRSVYRAGHPLHKSYDYTVMHISEVLQRRDEELPELMGEGRGKTAQNRVLVIDCVTNSASTPASSDDERTESPVLTPTMERKDSFSADKVEGQWDMDVLVRALCAQKGWNAIISRRKRGCLGCAIREAGALSWSVVIRV